LNDSQGLAGESSDDLRRRGRCRGSTRCVHYRVALAPADAVFYIQEGRVKLSIVSERGKEAVVAAKLKADRAARAEAEAVVDRWNRRLATGRDMLWSPTIRAALIARTSWLDVFCPCCGTSRSIDLRTVDRHPLASVGTLVLGLRAHGTQDWHRCRSCWDSMLCHQALPQQCDRSLSDSRTMETTV
jgi:hypothetical protein